MIALHFASGCIKTSSSSSSSSRWQELRGASEGQRSRRGSRDRFLSSEAVWLKAERKTLWNVDMYEHFHFNFSTLEHHKAFFSLPRAPPSSLPQSYNELSRIVEWRRGNNIARHPTGGCLSWHHRLLHNHSRALSCTWSLMMQKSTCIHVCLSEINKQTNN